MSKAIICALPVQDSASDAPPVSYSDITSGRGEGSYLDVITTEEAASLVSECVGVCVCG